MSQKYIAQSVINTLYNKYILCYTKGMRYTIKDFNKDFPNDDACLDSIFENRYGDVDTCPRCGVVDTKFYRVTGRKCYACMHCGYQLHPLAETIFHKSSTSLKLWFYAIYLFSVSKNGVSAKELERHLGVTYKTAHRMAVQIRKLMAQDNDKLSGIVEADETYYGGVNKRKRGSTRNTSFDNKKPVIGAVERYGRVKAVVADTASVSTAMNFLKATLAHGTELHTDESRIYKWVKNEFEHKSINHSAGVYVKNNVTTNSIEGFWGQLKRSIDGTYHCVSPKYLQTYVNEFVFRYNYRDVTVYPLLLEQASKLSR